MTDGSGAFSGLPAVGGKPIRLAFDDGRLTSDGGALLLAASSDRSASPNGWHDASRTRAILPRCATRSPR
jgi:hypothetical protein